MSQCKSSKCSPLACMHAFCRFVNFLKALLLLLLAPVVSDHSLSLAICTSLAFDLIQWHQHCDKFVAQYLISIVCTGIYARIIAFASNPCSRIVCIRILSTCDTFPIVTVLTKCSLLTNISKITSYLFTRQILAK